MAKLTGVVVGAIAAGVLATAGVGSTPTAQATCASFFGLGNSASCTSNPTSFAIAIGVGAQAHADGLFGTAFAVGAQAAAYTAGVLTFATAVGDHSAAASAGIVGMATQLGPNGYAATNGLNGGTNNPGFNFALNVSLGTTAAIGSVVLASGFGNAAVNLFGDGTTSNGHYVELNGNLNAGVNVGGIDNRVVAQGSFNGAFGILGKHNVVVADPGPFAIAGSILQSGQTIKKQGPGININGFAAGGAAAVGPQKTAVRHANTSPAAHPVAHSTRLGKKS
ncbi:hypothetical protein [Mycobacterium sp. RTGN5]|uniref:hypothetical protein n=1 Tax=Mycobacterium sp. RTGN5 TaxID=3016522 RepID=UPI0029C65C6B|nr:hypothetical protein [Mycobacterium sp. RTGN5]